MTRIEKFFKLKDHLVIGKSYQKLTTDEYLQCVKFIQDNEGLSKNDYCEKANRWMLDQPKPKHHADMWALVFQSA